MSAFSLIATGSRCSATQPVIPWPTRSFSGQCNLREDFLMRGGRVRHPREHRQNRNSHFNYCRYKFYDLCKNFMQRIGNGSHAAADFMEEINIEAAMKGIAYHVLR